ncbi:MAG: AAA family ATPase [Anaerolineales bacterium]|nr:AAA family ATPase [Anaerolineales bacterium]
MITALELDGFKTFHNFRIEFAPFQVIVGVNGVGKSNLFDAMQLLSRLASDNNLLSAFRGLRGEADELFTTHDSLSSAYKMRLAAEIFVERYIKDSWGAEAALKYTRLRYELEIERRKDPQGLERLYVTHESLTSIPRHDDQWIKRHKLSSSDWLPKITGGRSPFISTDPMAQTISLHQDGRSGRKNSNAEKVERTVLSNVTDTEFPHAFAAREEMRQWKFLHLNPTNLRQPSPFISNPYLSTSGENLAATLARIRSVDPYLLNDISRDIANLVPGIIRIEVEQDEVQKRYVIWAITQDGQRFSSRVLSDGTLRLLALTTLKYDPEYKGVLCFEEPENGVHPFRLENLVRSLRDLTTDFSTAEATPELLRQLLINTHSPVLVSQLDVNSELLFAHMVSQTQPEYRNVHRITKIFPVKAERQLMLDLGIAKAEEAYAVSEVVKYLDSTDLGEAQATVQKNGL